MSEDRSDSARSLARRIDDLARRVERLERKGVGRFRPAGAASASAGDLALVERLRTRRDRRYGAAGLRGAVAYAGAATFGERESLWIREHPLPQVMDLEPAGLARTLGALGHPARLALLRALLREPCSSQRLQEVLGLASVGQLYHHLKELLAAGVVSQTRRSQYEIAVHHVVPLLVILAAASDFLAEPGQGAGTEPADPPSVSRKE